MLFKRHILEGIAAGTITLAFRRWRRPTVRRGGTLKTAVGVLRFDDVAVVDAATLTDQEARRAGFESAQALRAELGPEDERLLYRIAFRRDGPDPRTALRADDRLDAASVSDLVGRLDRMDRGGPWTTATLCAFAQHPGLRAADLAGRLGRERDAFKIDVRKLKNLGLTESLEVGYRISPRGRALLRHLSKQGKG